MFRVSFRYWKTLTSMISTGTSYVRRSYFFFRDSTTRPVRLNYITVTINSSTGDVHNHFTNRELITGCNGLFFKYKSYIGYFVRIRNVQKKHTCNLKGSKCSCLVFTVTYDTINKLLLIFNSADCK